MVKEKAETKKEEFTNIHDKLFYIQQNLKVKKGQFNKFGNYKFRSCEDILEAVKPELAKTKTTVGLSDEIIMIGDRFYVKATAILRDGISELSNVSYAREPLSKKGMDEAQVTGATSSYARKYALNGLFGIDDEKDADTKDNREASDQKPTVSLDNILERIKKTTTKEKGQEWIDWIGKSKFTEDQKAKLMEEVIKVVKKVDKSDDEIDEELEEELKNLK